MIAITPDAAARGSLVDSGSAGPTAALWIEKSVNDAGGDIHLEGHDEIAEMVRSAGLQDFILNGCDHVLTSPRTTVKGDEAAGHSYAMNIRRGAAALRCWIARLSPRRLEGRQADYANLDGSPAPRTMLSRAAR